MKQRGCLTFLIEWVLAGVILAIIFSNINKTGQSTSSIIFTSVWIGFWIAFCIFAFRMVIITSKARKEVKRQLAADREAGISRYNNIIHVGGLEAPENCKASAAISSTTFTINCGGNEFVLDMTKIRNIDFQIDIDEKQYLKSSFAKGVIGAATFGVSGAVIGSAPKTKIKRETKCYAIISYESVQGEYKTFLLKDEYANTHVCAKLVDMLKPKINQQINRVEL